LAEQEDKALTEKEPEQSPPPKGEAPSRGGDHGDEEPESPLEKEADPGAPMWVTTFADLMSLLMCFFVMLLSMATIDVEKFKAMAEGLAKGLGAPPQSALQDLSVDDILTQADALEKELQKKTVIDADKLKKLLKPEIMRRQIELEVRERMITVRILQSGSFSAGSADLKQQFMPVAKRLRDALAKIEGAISVSGHTDNTPMKSKRFRSNWELSGSRAFSVIHALLKEQVLSPARFVLNGHGATRPLGENKTSTGRARNRRVEIVIDQRDVMPRTLETVDDATKRDTEILREVLRPEIEKEEVEVEDDGPEYLKGRPR